MSFKSSGHGRESWKIKGVGNSVKVGLVCARAADGSIEVGPDLAPLPPLEVRRLFLCFPPYMDVLEAKWHFLLS